MQIPSILVIPLLLVSVAAGTRASVESSSERQAGLQVARTDSVLAHDTFTIRSATLNEPRKVNVYLPPQYPNNRREFPVLFMPDGGLDEDFPHVTKTVDSLIAVHAIRPIIVVGIPNTQRRRDLTGPTRIKSDSAIAPQVCGSQVFRRFIRYELLPEIARRYRISPERGIIGESLAGLFIVETFLQEPDLFTHYIALDPSVWWNSGMIVDSAAAHLAKFSAKPRSLYIATSLEPGTSVGSSRIIDAIKAAPPRGLRWKYEPRPDLTHGTIFKGTKPTALVDAFH